MRLATQPCGEAGNVLQFVDVTRLAVQHCSEADNVLQLAAVVMASNVTTCGIVATMAAMHYNPSQRCAIVFFLIFYLTTSKEKKNGKKREVLKPAL
jgi:hypothetical protein